MIRFTKEAVSIEDNRKTLGPDKGDLAITTLLVGHLARRKAAAIERRNLQK
jgi:hypothetical protein